MATQRNRRTRHESSNPSTMAKRRASGGPARQVSLEPLEDRLLMFAPDGAWGQPGGPGSPVALRYSYSNLLNGGLLNGAGASMSTATIRASIEEALGTWTAVAPLQLTEVPDFGPPPSDGWYGGAAFPELRFGNEFIDGAPPLDELAHSWTPNFWNSVGVGALVGDVHFDNGDRWSAPMLTEVGAHEIGHALGLGHANGSNPSVATPALMDAFFAGNFGAPGTSFLFSDDVNGIRANYGAGLGFVLDAAGVLHINGTGGSDSITISSSPGLLTVSSAGNGSFTRTSGGVTAISVMARGGNDMITVESLPAFTPLTITGDAGDDTVNLAPSARNLASLGSMVTFNGGAGTNSAIINDSANSANASYMVGTGTVTRGGWAGFAYSGVSGITLGGSAGSCNYAVTGLSAGTNLVINDGAAFDTLDLAPTGQNLDAIQGNVTFAAGGSVGNQVRLFDQANGGNGTFSYGSNSITRASSLSQHFGKLSWSGWVSFVEMHAGYGNNDIDVNDSNAIQVSVYGGGGDDRIRLTPYTGYANSVGASVWVDGGPGNDMVFVNDSTAGSISDGDWTLAGTSLDKSTSPASGALVSWAAGSIENVTLWGGGWGTHYAVTSLPAGVTATLNAGGGDDTFDVGSPVAGSRNLDYIQGTLYLNGQAGTNTLNYNDSDNNYTPLYIVWPGWPPPPPARGDSYYVTGSSVRRDRSGVVNYGGVQALNVLGGTAPNDFYVTPSASTTMYVNGNSPTPPLFSGTPTSGEWDRITVDYTSTTNPVLTINRFGGSGTYSFADRAPVSYADIEFYNAPPTVLLAPLIPIGVKFSTTSITATVLA